METSKQRPRAKARSKSASSPTLPATVYLRQPGAVEPLVLSGELERQVAELASDLTKGACRTLMFGAPGLGKTQTVTNIAATVNRPFWWVRAEQFAAALVKEGGFDFRSLFAAAADAQAVLVFDDFDGFVKKRDERTDTPAMRAAVAGWLAAMDEFAGRVSIIATTNLPGSFEPAMFRRFERLLHYKRLGDDDLKRLLQSLLEGVAEIPQSLLMEARQLSPAELADMAAGIAAGENAVSGLESRMQQRLRAIRIAGIPAH